MEALSQPTSSTDPLQYSQELVERLNILRKNERFCDVKVEVKDKEFNAHKAVLAAASPFFFTLLASDMRESKEQLIKIELEEATASVMEDVLQYVYTGNVSITEESAHNLIATADYLFLSGLKTMACNFLKENVTVENCIFNYYFADKYQCVELRGEALDVINSNFTAVMETDDFLNLNTKQVMEWVSSDDITVNAEEEVFKGIVMWVSHNKSEREIDFPSLLHHIRLVSISHDFLLNKLVKEELVAKNTELRSNVVLDAMRVMASTSSTDNERVIQQPRKCLETHTDMIFVCGVKTSLCYFPNQNLWYKLSNMLYSHNLQHAPSQCKGKIYFPSRATELGGSYLMQCYMPTSNSWGAFQVATTVKYSAVLKDDLYAIDAGSEIYRYDFENNHFNKLKKPPAPIPFDGCVVADEHHIYVLGGSCVLRGGSVSTTLRFNPIANEWDEVAPMSEARCNAFGSAMNGKVYVAGGLWRNKVFSLCEVYSPLAHEWQVMMSSLNVPRVCASMVCYEGKLYVLGGFNFVTCGRIMSQTRVLSVEVLDCERNKWKKKSVIPVKCFETDDEEEKNKFKACFARLCKGMIDKLKPLG